MRKKIEFQAECIADDPTSLVKRYKVIGGWLVVHFTVSGKNVCESSVFISDPHHEWYVLKPHKENPLEEKANKYKEFEAK